MGTNAARLITERQKEAGRADHSVCLPCTKAQGAHRATLCFLCLKCWLQRASARWAWTIFWCSTRVCLVQHNQSCDVSPGTKMGRYCVAFQGVCSGCLATPSKPWMGFPSVAAFDRPPKLGMFA